MLERDGWIVINVKNRKLGIIISMTEGAREFLKVAGFHTGETMFVGERQSVLSIRVERIPKESHREFLAEIHGALPVELRSLPVAFL